MFAVAAHFLAPWVATALSTVSTDDAYVNGHYTFVAPRVAGQVKKVLVDDNYRVKKGDLLVELDPEPYQVQVAINKAAVEAAETDLANAQAQMHGLVAQGTSLRWGLQHAMEDVNDQVALLRANVAMLEARKASLAKAQADFRRAEALLPSHAIAVADYDQCKAALLVAEAQVKQALESIYQIRVSLGLPAQPSQGHDLAWVPPDLDQTFSAVRQAQAALIQIGAQLGMLVPSALTPRRMLEDFEKQAPGGDIDRLLGGLASQAPAVKQAEARLRQAHRALEQAELNLRYCDITSEIDGVVLGRNVNPGYNVQAGQAMMAVRSITEIWIDANFKETQLADLRIGQRSALRGGHVRQPPGVRGPDHRVHHGDRPDALPAAAAERHRQLREDRPAAAGPGRVDRLRPGQGPAVRRAVGDALRVLQGTAHGTARGGSAATEEGMKKRMRDEGGQGVASLSSLIPHLLSLIYYRLKRRTDYE